MVAMEIESVSGRHCFMQVEVGLDQRICCIPAVHAPPALHSHEALRPVKVKNWSSVIKPWNGVHFMMVPPSNRYL
jgi:hypothetical protein